MTPQELPVQIEESERLARFITQDKWVRADGTVRHNAFMPPSDLNFSVTRTRALSEDELWQIGRDVIAQIGVKSNVLQGRSDLTTEMIKQAKLVASSFPLTNNPSHAHVHGWPIDKENQKLIAQELAAAVGTLIKAPTI